MKSSSSSTINEIDQLTLELLTSRKQYNQYLKQTDSKKYLEQTDFFAKIQRHKSSLMEVIQNLLDDPNNHSYSNEVNDTFIPFIRAIFKYNESVQCMQQTEYAEDQDQDILFDNCIETEEPQERESFDEPSDVSNSKNMIHYSMQMFMKPNSQFFKNKIMERQKQKKFTNKNNGNENNITGDYNEYEYYDSEEKDNDEEI